MVLGEIFWSMHLPNLTQIVQGLTKFDNLWAMMSEDKREDYQNCSVLYCVLKLCTVISTLRWAVLTVHWIGFCHTGSISLCVDSFVFVCFYFVFLFYTAYMSYHCNTVGWSWWDWSPILRTLSSFSALTLLVGSFLTRKNPFPMWPIMCLVGH